MSTQNTLNWIALLVLATATYLQHYWVWGAFFIFWSIRSVFEGRAFLVSDVDRLKSPILFWVFCAFWAAFGLWYFLGDILWRIEIYQLFGFDLYGE